MPKYCGPNMVIKSTAVAENSKMHGRMRETIREKFFSMDFLALFVEKM